MEWANYKDNDGNIMNKNLEETLNYIKEFREQGIIDGIII